MRNAARLESRAAAHNPPLSMKRVFYLLLALSTGGAFAQTGDPVRGLSGRVEGRTYISPTGYFRIAIPVLPELGGSITDTENVVTFQDSFNVHVSIGVFPQDATQRWELSTRGLKDYFAYFFDTYVMPDFQNAFPGGKVESVGFSETVMGGSLIAYTLLPGGSMFAAKSSILGGDETPPVAKRGNLIFVRNNVIYVITTELAERVTERSAYRKTKAEEDEILRDRLVELARRIEFTRPATPR
ncbi:MAG: hypothetical protein JWM88_2049 [Verrucomicrobia bacterium]|nr:hypothetical protein [Verrucomicrobiota bacterium]